MRQQKITVPGASNPIIQNYTYDSLNRLKSATETANGNSTVTWRQTFLYDRFGNRRFDANNTTTLLANNGTYNPQIDANTNKFLVAEGYNYDSEGNLTGNPENQLFTYDAENRQTQVTNTASNTSANYFYDGNGKRIRKIVGQEETVFVYDAFGKLVAEYSTVIDNRPKATSYLTSDDLGSPRIVTNQVGQVVSRHDYQPFGEEVMANVGGRTTAQGYAGNDGVRNQFTGYERDVESGLDYAQARYYKSRHGRFTSVDPLTASANIKNPQTFNRYSYGLNSPYKFVDPTGLEVCTPGNYCTQGQESVEGEDRETNALSSTHVNKNGDVIAIFDDGDLGVYKHSNIEKWDGKSVLPKTGKGVTKIGETSIIDEFADHSAEGGGYTVYPFRPGRPIIIEANARIDLSLNFDSLFDQMVRDWKDSSLASLALNGQNNGDLDIKVNGEITRYGVGAKFKGKFITYRGLGNYLFGYLAGRNANLTQDGFMQAAGEYQSTGSKFSAGLVATGLVSPTNNVKPYYGEGAFSGYYLTRGFDDGFRDFLWGR